MWGRKRFLNAFDFGYLNGPFFYSFMGYLTLKAKILLASLREVLVAMRDEYLAKGGSLPAYGSVRFRMFDS